MKLKKIIKKIVFGTPLRQLWWRYKYARKFHGAKASLLTKLEKIGDEHPKRTIRKMRHACIGHLWLPDEYIAYQYDLLSQKGRRQFVLNWEKTEFCEKVNSKKCWQILDDKYASYEHFKPYYKREAICLSFKDKALEVEKLKWFFMHGDSVIAKPLSKGCGMGIEKFYHKDYASVEMLYEALSKRYEKCIVEEIVQQDPRMACFHPESVNTLRMSVLRLNGDLLFFHPFLRLGQGSAVVDNGGAGGIIAPVDVETGIVTEAVTELGIHFVCHPDTHLPIVGFQIPLWEEAKAFTRELMDHIPEGIYVSWDLALSNGEWLMIEGNVQGQFIGQQMPHKKGVRKEYEEIKRTLHVK